jgi:co-chaperonin GroES (HSP10)
MVAVTKVGYIANRGRLIVEVFRPASEQNGIQLPDSAVSQAPKLRAKILAVGGHELTANGEIVPHFFAKGDVVLLSVFTTAEPIHKDIYAVRFNEVLALETDGSN